MTDRQYDPTFLNTRREAVVIFATWVVTLLWSVPYCYFAGYDLNVAELKTVLGMPAWVVWGVAIPWIAASVFTIWFCAFVMVDDDLGELTGEPEPPE